MNAIVNTMEELGFVRNQEQKEALLAMSTQQLMKDFVFPHCLCLPRSGVRYPRISGSFMKLMTKHGRDFLQADYELGSILLECAMQRITRHPDLPAINYRDNLPDAYKQYAASSVNRNGYNGCPDEPGLWGNEEVNFLVKMLPVCLELRNPVYADHAKLILFQMVSLLDKKKGGCRSFLWIDSVDLAQTEVWNIAGGMLYEAGLVREFTDYCVGQGWRSGMNLFSSVRFYGQDEEYLLNRIDLDKETYYRGFKRGFLKLCGLYNKMTRKRVAEEIRFSK